MSLGILLAGSLIFLKGAEGAAGGGIGTAVELSDGEDEAASCFN